MISLGREPQENDHSKRNLAAERRKMPGRDIYAAFERAVQRQRKRAGCIPPLHIRASVIMGPEVRADHWKSKPHPGGWRGLWR